MFDEFNQDHSIALYRWMTEKYPHREDKDYKSDYHIKSKELQSLISHLFNIINSLYLSANETPTVYNANSEERAHFEGSNNIRLMRFEPPHYINFLANMGLLNDLEQILRVLTKGKYDLHNLETSINELFDAVNEFRTLRNFYTHFDERLLDLEKHGVDGEKELNCGMYFGKNVKNNFYVVILKDTIYFSDRKKHCSKVIGKKAFVPIFDAANKICRTFCDAQNVRQETKERMNNVYTFIPY